MLRWRSQHEPGAAEQRPAVGSVDLAGGGGSQPLTRVPHEPPQPERQKAAHVAQSRGERSENQTLRWIHICIILGMVGADLLREARLRAGLTQAELAERSGTARSQISRYERGDVLPSLETLRRLVRACGLELSFRIFKLDVEEHDAALIAQTLALTPEQRVDRAVRAVKHLYA